LLVNNYFDITIIPALDVFLVYVVLRSRM